MKNIVNIENQELKVTIRDIIKFSGNKYESIRDLISRNKKEFQEIGLSYAKDMTDFKSAVFEDNLKLNEEQTSFLFVLMNNTPEVVKFKFNLVKQFYILKNKVCEINRDQLKQKENQLLIAQNETIEAKRKIYAHPRNNGFETVSRIISDYNINMTSYDLNQLLVSKGLLSVETVEVNHYKGLQMSGNTPLVHADTVIKIVDDEGFGRGLGYIDTHETLF